MTGPQSDRWLDAIRAVMLLAIDPQALRGAVVRGAQGAAGEQWLSMASRFISPEQAPVYFPANADLDAVRGSVDLMATLCAGKPQWTPGIIQRTGAGLLIARRVEQLSPAVMMTVGRALQRRQISSGEPASDDRAQFVMIALDDSAPSEPVLANGLTAQMALAVDLTGISAVDIQGALPGPELVEQARKRLPGVAVSDQDIRDLCDVGTTLGVTGMTGIVLAVQAARASAALSGYANVSSEDLALATRLVLAHRATRLPQADCPDQADTAASQNEPNARDEQSGAADAEQSQQAQSSRPESDASGRVPDAEDGNSLANVDVLVESARAVVPPELLNQLMASTTRLPSSSAGGRFGAMLVSDRRGRAVGVRAGRPRDGDRINLSATVRAAIPYQRVRREQRRRHGRPSRGGIEFRPGDMRVHRYKHSATTQTIFVVDASGSAAAHRLAEAKGAVELLLADCYVRRDTVSLISFRGQQAQLILPATRSLARAKRELARMPGGGGTPTASALQVAISEAGKATQSGQKPILIILTDGRANVTLDGTGSRVKATEQAAQAAHRIASLGIESIVIDTAIQNLSRAAPLADALQGEFIRLPYADAGAIQRVVRDHRVAG